VQTATAMANQAASVGYGFGKSSRLATDRILTHVAAAGLAEARDGGGCNTGALLGAVLLHLRTASA